MPTDHSAHPADYHEYVFGDGKLIGRFDDMYRFAQGVPWAQDTRCNDWYAEVGLLMVGERGPFESILEMACGLGYFASKVQRAVLKAGGTMHAFDISPEAVRRAAQLHHGIEFWSDDLRRADYQPRQQYDLVVLRDTFFYLHDAMATVLTNIGRSVRPGGYVYVCQPFPALDRPFVGREVIPDPDALLQEFASYRLIHSMRLRRHLAAGDGPMLHFVAQRMEEDAVGESGSSQRLW